MAVREVTINISPAAIIGDVTLRGGREERHQTTTSNPRPVYKKNLHGRLLFYLLKIKIEP
jgi:hypothetical protein